ncbi:MAG: hypothetical protein IPJ61_18110 [Tessaracoccus sp.]|uniref:hypothetical protein n=1 Tax=Tessaracoccus sp. TaxID=1971211 RepID=UPI001ED277C3|nr:hypothetical protein [Tessaracoccus sp.]MBK7822908.1 hypothetical protein [Tessaracoccus sp.]
MRAEAFDRIIDQTWRRTSYSGLTAGLHDAPAGTVADEPESLGFDTPLVDPVSVLGTRDSRREARVHVERSARISGLDRSSPMADLPAGAGFGTLVHAVLERLDWAPDAVEAQAPVLVAELAPELGLTKSEAAQLAAALVDVCRTPLLPVSDLALTDLPVTDRLRNSTSTSPRRRRCPGDTHRPRRPDGRLAAADDLLAPYPARLRASRPPTPSSTAS